MAPVRILVGVASALAATMVSLDVAAFVFSDGTTAVCKAGDRTVIEIDAPSGSRLVQLGHAAATTAVGSGYQIQWNPQKLAVLPPAVHDFIFFHECAHAQIPTTDEVRANCAGLKAMRAAGRAGFALESKLTLFFGADNEYWMKTIKCANAEPDSSAPASAPR
jgi:hypothetical protein